MCCSDLALVSNRFVSIFSWKWKYAIEFVRMRKREKRKEATVTWNGGHTAGNCVVEIKNKHEIIAIRSKWEKKSFDKKFASISITCATPQQTSTNVPFIGKLLQRQHTLKFNVVHRVHQLCLCVSWVFSSFENLWNRPTAKRQTTEIGKIRKSSICVFLRACEWWNVLQPPSNRIRMSMRQNVRCLSMSEGKVQNHTLKIFT